MKEHHIHIHFSDSFLKNSSLRDFSLRDAPETKNASEAAATLGHFGGLARAATLAPGRRKQIAVKAAKARWRKKKAESGKSLPTTNK